MEGHVSPDEGDTVPGGRGVEGEGMGGEERGGRMGEDREEEEGSDGREGT